MESIDVATYADGAPAFMAALDGVLSADRGCLVVGREQGHRGLVVFRAEDVDWDGDTLTYDGRRYRLGDRIDLMGGFMTLRRLKGLHLPEEWADTAEAFVVAPAGP
jgi:hypothetical protein